MKWDSKFDQVAGDLVAFVDDLRISGYSEEHAWAIARQVASRLDYLGIQDARASAELMVEPGLARLCQQWEAASQKQPHKKRGTRPRTTSGRFANPTLLRRIQHWTAKSWNRNRLLCHLSMTFDQITSLLKGLHLTLAAHDPGRDKEGWKLSDNAWPAFVHE